MLPIAEAALMLGVSVAFLKELGHAGEIPTKRLGRKWLVKRAWVDAFTGWPEEASTA
jgi:excisionase family DNA binding protein